MIHVVTNEQRAFYAPQLEAMHQRRREVFIEERGWKLQEHDGGEYDAGDDEQAIYLMMLDMAGRLQVSVRVRPVLDWSMLIDEMPQCVEGNAEALRRPDVWEMARHLANGAGSAVGEARSRSAEFRIAMLEAAREHGINRLVGSVDVGLLAHGIRSWLDLKPLGIPVVYPEGGAAVGYEIPVTDDLIARLRVKHGINEAVAYQMTGFPPPGLSPAILEQAMRADRAWPLRKVA